MARLDKEREKILFPIEIEHQYPSSYDLYLSENLEVIGNIYDNQELIK